MGLKFQHNPQNAAIKVVFNFQAIKKAKCVKYIIDEYKEPGIVDMNAIYLGYIQAVFKFHTYITECNK